MRYVLLFVMLLAISSPTFAQGDDVPLYIECDAEEYMIEVYYLLDPMTETIFELAISPAGEEHDQALADAYIAFIEIRDELMEMEDVPKCAQTYHELMLTAASGVADSFALEAFAGLTGDDHYTELSEQRQAEVEQIGEEIMAESLILGWIDEDGMFVNEPPPLDDE